MCKLLAQSTSAYRLSCSCTHSKEQYTRHFIRLGFSRRTARDIYKHCHREPSQGQEQLKHDLTFNGLLQKAEHCTFHHPHGQTMGRAGRRCILEDGERILDKCIALRPDSIPARMMLVQNLMFQARGREEEVPALVLALLHQTSLWHCSSHHPEAKQALLAVKMGLGALVLSQKKYKAPEFVQLATAAVPELKTAILELLDYAERQAERKRPSFTGTDSFDDLM